MDNVWDVEYRLRCVLVNKQLCAKAAEIIRNLAKDLDYHEELLKDAQADIRILEERLKATEAERNEAQRYIKEHF